MKRYDMEWDGIASTFMEATESGEYVKYEEAATEIERLQARNELLESDVLHWKGMTKGRESEIDKHLARVELLDKVVEASSACITAWDDAKWPSPIPLRKALAALKEQA